MSPAVPHALAPPCAVLQAPPHWQNIDFISDLHLQAGEPATFDAWQDFMLSTRANAVFILGDLFEVWVGDDVFDAAAAPGPAAARFETRCARVLQAAARRCELFFMHGNRDFLLGPAFAKACGMTLLDDPTVLDFAGQRWLLSHGDALCLADSDYLKFRAQVRSRSWQQNFLDQPLAQREALARALRQQSANRQRSGMKHADLDAGASCDWLQAAQAHTLIHGHTHQPAEHDLGHGLRRICLSDWDAGATPARAEVLRLSAARTPQVTGCSVRRLDARLTN